MSDPASPREWRLYVQDMLAFCDTALRYTAGLDRTTFALDETWSGGLRCHPERRRAVTCLPEQFAQLLHASHDDRLRWHCTVQDVAAPVTVQLPRQRAPAIKVQ